MIDRYIRARDGTYHRLAHLELPYSLTLCGERLRGVLHDEPEGRVCPRCEHCHIPELTRWDYPASAWDVELPEDVE